MMDYTPVAQDHVEEHVSHQTSKINFNRVNYSHEKLDRKGRHQ
jgi:hypothetical protein